MWDDQRGGILLRGARIADLADDAAADDWLTAAERRELERYRDARRRTAWLCGRLLGKRLVLEGPSRIAQRFIAGSEPSLVPVVPEGRLNRGRAETGQPSLRDSGRVFLPPHPSDESLGYCHRVPTGRPASELDLRLADIEILSRNERGGTVRPVVRVRGVELDWSLSISHTDRLVIAALARCDDCCVGIDVVSIPDVNPAALSHWFTAREVEILRESSPAASEQPGCWARAWAIKEAAYKALNDGESFTPRRIEITRTAAGGFAIRYNGIDLHEHCTVESRELDGHVAALVTSSKLRRTARRGKPSIIASCH